MTNPSDGQQATAYTIQCTSCGQPFDAVTASLCQCLTPVNTPVCPDCGQCLCRLSKEEQRQFWSGAPPILWSKRMTAGKAGASETASPGPQDLKRPLALVADDEPATRTIAARLLEKMGYGVVAAANGVEALRLAKELRPDLLLSDALMPKLGGRELAKTLKDDPETASIKVVLMTSIYTKASNRTEALHTFHCDGFLKKPVSASDLKAILGAGQLNLTPVSPPEPNC